MNKIVLSVLMLFAGFFRLDAQGNELNASYWWPQQKAPDKIVRCKRPTTFEDQMLAQSVAGLAAKAVNSGTSDEMVWIENTATQYNEWYKMCVRRLSAVESDAQTAWELAVKYRNAGIIKGFIVYKKDDLKQSLNIATVYAGLRDGILVEESEMQTALDKGFNLLVDARPLDYQTCFLEEKDNLNPNLIVIVSPASLNNRDLAIAQKSMVYYGVTDFYETILEWMNPISPIVGWNEGAESTHVAPPSRWGHFNTASDFCLNLPLLSAGSADEHLPVIKTIDPKTIDYNTDSHYHAFVMSDGDNMQWTMNSFFNKEYFRNACTKQMVSGWTSCPLNLSMMAPDVWDYMASLKNDETSLVEFSGGYFYPDVFAEKRGETERWELLRSFAKKANVHMKRTGVKVLNFITLYQIDSENARKAYQIYAEEIEDLTGIIAIQYNPYHNGGGEIYWLKNKNGIEIPVVTARYSLWGKINKPGFGRPDQVASYINNDTESTSAADKQLMNWSIVHAWSRYKKQKDGSIKDVDNSSSEGIRGFTPVKWCTDLLNPAVKTVTIEELLWRIRMKHNPEQTEQIINNK